MNTIRSLLTAGRGLFAGVTTPRNGKHPTHLLIPRNSKNTTITEKPSGIDQLLVELVDIG